MAMLSKSNIEELRLHFKEHQDKILAWADIGLNKVIKGDLIILFI
jgi:hypothetical protein